MGCIFNRKKFWFNAPNQMDDKIHNRQNMQNIIQNQKYRYMRNRKNSNDIDKKLYKIEEMSIAEPTNKLKVQTKRKIIIEYLKQLNHFVRKKNQKNINGDPYNEKEDNKAINKVGKVNSIYRNYQIIKNDSKPNDKYYRNLSNSRSNISYENPEEINISKVFNNEYFEKRPSNKTNNQSVGKFEILKREKPEVYYNNDCYVPKKPIFKKEEKIENIHKIQVNKSNEKQSNHIHSKFGNFSPSSLFLRELMNPISKK